jgi:hypothetical protein
LLLLLLLLLLYRYRLKLLPFVIPAEILKRFLYLSPSLGCNGRGHTEADLSSRERELWRAQKSWSLRLVYNFWGGRGEVETGIIIKNLKSRICFEKLVVADLGKKAVDLHWSRRLISTFIRAHYWSLSWDKWILSTPSHPYFKIDFSTTHFLKSTPK